MQTFLPYSDFNLCAEALDDVRLNKQITECAQILSALVGDSAGWRYHPATLMWSRSRRELYHYIHAMHTEWLRRRGYSSSHRHRSYQKFADTWTAHRLGDTQDGYTFYNQPLLTRSHRIMLTYKDPSHYGAQFSDVTGDDLVNPRYVWWSPSLGLYTIDVANDMYVQLTP